MPTPKKPTPAVKKSATPAKKTAPAVKKTAATPKKKTVKEDITMTTYRKMLKKYKGDITKVPGYDFGKRTE